VGRFSTAPLGKLIYRTGWARERSPRVHPGRASPVAGPRERRGDGGGPLNLDGPRRISQKSVDYVSKIIYKKYKYKSLVEHRSDKRIGAKLSNRNYMAQTESSVQGQLLEF